MVAGPSWALSGGEISSEVHTTSLPLLVCLPARMDFADKLGELGWS